MRRFVSLLTAFAAAACFMSVLASAADAQEGVFLTEADAPAAAFGNDASFVRQVVAATPELRSAMRQRLGNMEPSVWENEYVAFKATRGDTLLGYAVIVEEIGKHRAITFVVGVRTDGTINDVAVMAYREAYGGEIKAKRFLNQYRGKSGSDALHAPDDVKNIAGATLSVDAASRAVKKAIAVVHAAFGDGAGQ
ncbi:MAG: FMN-binding protein [Deltaproteobacteria bacterium]|nr:FMN-binding protein [Deltaproteobacteria bacterium]